MCLAGRSGRQPTCVVEWCVYVTQAKIDFLFLLLWKVFESVCCGYIRCLLVFI